MTEIPASQQAAVRIGGRTVEQYLQPHGRVFQRTLRLVLPLFLAWFRIRAYGAEQVPRTGGVLLCPNHSSYLDPVLQVKPQTRVVRYMCKASLFRFPILRTILLIGGAFPVRRGERDSAALDIGRDLLIRGDTLLIYPEGTRARSADELGVPRRGALRLAIETDVAVIPIATYGLKPRAALGRSAWPPLGKVTILYGAPMHFGHYPATPDGAATARDELWAEITRLYDLARELDQRPSRPRHWTIPPRS